MEPIVDLVFRCNHCGTTAHVNVDTALYKSFKSEHDSYYSDGACCSIVSCPKCEEISLLKNNYDFGAGIYEYASVLYPNTSRKMGTELPKNIIHTFEEAETCYHARAYTASAIMCRKVLEAICEEYKAEGNSLIKRLEFLLNNKTIDNRLYEWASGLRIVGNKAAHGVHYSCDSRDANDVLDFTHALCEYLFTYREKFEKFKLRQEKTPKK